MGLFSSKSKHSKNNEYILPIETTEGFKLTPAGQKSNFVAPHALTREEVIGNSPKQKTKDIKMSGGVSPLDALKQKSLGNVEKVQERVATKENTVTPKVKPVERNISSDVEVSLLDKCMPYIKEAGTPQKKAEPVYTLDSVESILNTETIKTDELLSQLSTMGTVTIDTLGKKAPDVSTKAQTPTATNQPKKKPDEIILETPAEKKQELEATRVIPTISDIDNATSVNINYTTEFEDISSGTRIIDLSTEMFEENITPVTAIPTTKGFLDDEFSVEQEYTSYNDLRRIGGKLTAKRNGARAKMIFTILFTAILSFGFSPSVYMSLNKNPSAFQIIVTLFYGVLCLINLDMFAKLPSLFKKNAQPEAAIGVPALFTIIYVVFSLIRGINPFYVVMFSAIAISFKTIALFMREKYILNNFRVIATNNVKCAVRFIDDRQVTFAMAKNSIDGDVLVGCPNKTKHIGDFMRNSLISPVMNGALSKFFIVSMIISVVASVLSAINASDFSVLLSSLPINFGFLLAPTLLFTDILPLARTSKRLNKMGAMISGTLAADDIEKANAVALTANYLFGPGAISLYDMKILDSNQIDTTLIDAAAITKLCGSPLYPLFNSIAKSQGAELPDGDSVKYEEQLGVSGWVKDRHVFIGNRTLLEAHGINVPPIAVDKKILQNGYFPIYLACNDKPCALLIVKYNVKKSTANELRKLCNSGVTVLVDSCDPNITSEMICDYFGLYEDAARVMNSSGVQLYNGATEYSDSLSAGAAFRGNSDGYLSIFNCAAKIKRAVKSLTAAHIVLSICSFAGNIYSTVLGDSNTLSSGLALMYIGLTLIISYIIYLFNRP